MISIPELAALYELSHSSSEFFYNARLLGLYVDEDDRQRAADYACGRRRIVMGLTGGSSTVWVRIAPWVMEYIPSASWGCEQLLRLLCDLPVERAPWLVNWEAA